MGDPDNPGKYRVYIYGSHDTEVSTYCGRNQVVWSAPVDNLNDWRFDGVIFENVRDANGNLLNQEGKGDILYAPDVALVVEPNGKKTYYLYPNVQAGGRNGLVAKSDRPDGPFTVTNWSKENPTVTDGVLGLILPYLLMMTVVCMVIGDSKNPMLRNLTRRQWQPSNPVRK